MDSKDIQTVKSFLTALNGSITNYENSLNPLLGTSLEEMLNAVSTNEEKIEILNNFAYVFVSTIFTYLKTMGIDTDNHPIKNELSRVKVYMARYKDLMNGVTKNKAQEEEYNSRSKQFLTNTLGIKNVENSTLNDNQRSIAISNDNFAKGKHTKFKDEREEEVEEEKTMNGDNDSIPLPKITKKKMKKLPTKSTKSMSSLRSKKNNEKKIKKPAKKNEKNSRNDN